MSRDVTLRGTMADLFGDETYELWLKHESDDWEFNQAGDVVVDSNSQQDFIIPTLILGDDYVAQIRLTRAGRYRAGYLTADPDGWPSSSRCEFTPGALVGVGAPTIDDGVWERTSISTTDITLTITPADATKDLRIFRNGVSIDTISGPFVGDVTYIDHTNLNGENNEYVAKHTAGFLDGPWSDPFDVWGGPAPLDDFVRTSADDHYPSYTVTWSGSDDVRVEDDFLCLDVFSDVSGGTVNTGTLEVSKEGTLIPPGGTMTATFHARARREVTSFTVTDVSDWAEALIIMLIDDDNTDYQSCP